MNLPPEVTGLFSNNLQSIPIQRSITEPSDNLKSARMFAATKSSFITEDAGHRVSQLPHQLTIGITNPSGNSIPRSVAHTRYERELNVTPK